MSIESNKLEFLRTLFSVASRAFDPKSKYDSLPDVDSSKDSVSKDKDTAQDYSNNEEEYFIIMPPSSCFCF